MNFRGNYEKSDNQEYIITWSDKNPQDNMPQQKRSNNSFLLFKKRDLILEGEEQDPNECHVANNGTFIITNYPNSDNLDDYGTFYAITHSGEVIISYKPDALCLKCAISPNGKYAILQTNHGICENEGNKLCLFDLDAGELLWELTPVWWADSYSINEEKEFVYLHLNQRKYRYSFQGEFLDNELDEDNMLEVGDGYDIFNFAENKLNKLKKENADPTDFLELIPILTAVTDKKVSEYTKATVYRNLGEIYLDNDLKKEAMINFKHALRWYPKIGVKRTYDKLVKELK